MIIKICLLFILEKTTKNSLLRLPNLRRVEKLFSGEIPTLRRLGKCEKQPWPICWASSGRDRLSILVAIILGLVIIIVIFLIIQKEKTKQDTSTN